MRHSSPAQMHGRTSTAWHRAEALLAHSEKRPNHCWRNVRMLKGKLRVCMSTRERNGKLGQGVFEACTVTYLDTEFEQQGICHSGPINELWITEKARLSNPTFPYRSPQF